MRDLTSAERAALEEYDRLISHGLDEDERDDLEREDRLQDFAPCSDIQGVNGGALSAGLSPGAPNNLLVLPGRGPNTGGTGSGPGAIAPAAGPTNLDWERFANWLPDSPEAA